jgi:hypothetical protein
MLGLFGSRTGIGNEVIDRTMAVASRMLRARSETSLNIRSSRPRSPPALKAVPAPVSTTAWQPGSVASLDQTVAMGSVELLVGGVQRFRPVQADYRQAAGALIDEKWLGRRHQLLLRVRPGLAS